MNVTLDSGLRVVLDTNVVLSALVFTQGRMAALRHAWQSQRFVPVADKQTVVELTRVLAYRKFRIDTEEQKKLLADYLPYVEAHTLSPGGQLASPAVQCRDPKDQMFLDLAQEAKVDALVTGDEDLLVLDDPRKKRMTFRIITPQQFLLALSHEKN